jgi:hypothetical protein
MIVRFQRGTITFLNKFITGNVSLMLALVIICVRPLLILKILYYLSLKIFLSKEDV